MVMSRDRPRKCKPRNGLIQGYKWLLRVMRGHASSPVASVQTANGVIMGYASSPLAKVGKAAPTFPALKSLHLLCEATLPVLSGLLSRCA